MPTRDDLHALVSSLPEEALEPAHAMLAHFQTWPPPEPPEVKRSIEDLERRMHEQVEQMERDHPLGGGGGFGSLTFETDSRDPLAPARILARRGRHSSGYEQDGESVYLSAIQYEDYDFRLVERIRRDAADGAVTVTLELTGPDGETARHEHRYWRK